MIKDVVSPIIKPVVKNIISGGSVPPPVPGIRITEDFQNRITESGDDRVTE